MASGHSDRRCSETEQRHALSSSLISQNHHFLGASSSTNLTGLIVMPPTVTLGMFSFWARLRQG